MSVRSNNVAIVIGSGPGIGSHTAAAFASKRFNKMALVARNDSQLQKDAATVTNAASDKVQVNTYCIDITDGDKLTETLRQITSELGTPEFILFNAAIVASSSLFEFSEEDILKDINISIIALYRTSKWAMPRLISLAKQDPSAKPTLMVTNSHFPETPDENIFSLSLAKAAQKNLTRSLRQKFSSKGIHICLLTVAGSVADGNPNLNSKNIANKAWELYDQQKDAWTEDIRIED